MSIYEICERLCILCHKHFGTEFLKEKLNNNKKKYVCRFPDKLILGSFLKVVILKL